MKFSVLIVKNGLLMSFNCVSKQWSSLITNPHFVCLHNPLSPSASASALLFVSSSSKRSNPDYQFIPLDISDEFRTPFKTLNFINDPLGSGISVLRSCSGLLLCASYRAGEVKRRYYVHNPTLGYLLPFLKLPVNIQNMFIV